MKLSIENQFVINTLRYFLRQKTLFQPDELFDNVDWDKILPFAKHQNVLTIIYHVLLKNGLLEKVPPEKAQALEADFIGKTAFILQYENSLSKIVDSLYQERISFVIIKGPTIANELYEPTEVRPYGDLDILIKNHNYDKVKRILAQHGFQVADSENETHRRQYWNSVDFYHSENRNIAIDLHWDTLMSSWGRNFFTDQEIWDNTRWLEFSGMRLPVLDPMILILHLCLHLSFHHQFGKLQTLCDLDLAIQKFDTDIDWEQMLQIVSKMKIWKAVIYSMRLSKILLETELPEPIEMELKNKKIVEQLFPFSYLVFRSAEIPEMTGRIIRFLLIDDFNGKLQSLTSFYQRFKFLKST